MKYYRTIKLGTILTIVVLAISGTLFTLWTIVRTNNDLCNNLLTIGSLAANAINYKGLTELSGSESDSKVNYYQRRKEQLADMKYGIPNSRFLYIIGQKPDGTIFFFVDSEPQDSKAYSRSGQINAESPDKIKKVFRTHNAEIARYTDRGGNWVSVFVPIINHSTGKAVAVLGVDVDAKNWNNSVINNASLSIGLFLAVLTMIFILFLLTQSKKKIKEHQRETVESEKRLRTLFQAAPDPYLIIIDGIIVDCNNATEVLLSGIRTQIIGKTPADISPNFQPDGTISADVVKIMIQKSLNFGNHIFEWVHRSFSGENIWVEVSVSVLILNEKKAQFVSWRNIAKRKEAEAKLFMLNDQLRLSNDAIEANLYQKNALIEELSMTQIELEQINSEKDKLFSIIAHDLKNPFVALINNADLLLLSFDKLDDDKKISMIQGMKDASQATFSLLENLLQWSRAQRGLIKFEPEELNIFILVHSSIDPLNLLVEAKSITLENNVPLGLFVNADKNLTTTIIRNLVSNAIKFTPAYGLIEINAEETDKEFIISIADSGVGMAPDTIAKLFNINTHVSTKGTAGEKGTGLGLLLCKEFIEKHNGKIWAESVIGKGSTFYFTLPNN